MKFRTKKNFSDSDIQIGGIYKVYYRYKSLFAGFYHFQISHRIPLKSKKFGQQFSGKPLSGDIAFMSANRNIYLKDFVCRIK